MVVALVRSVVGVATEEASVVKVMAVPIAAPFLQLGSHRPLALLQLPHLGLNLGPLAGLRVSSLFLLLLLQL